MSNVLPFPPRPNGNPLEVALNAVAERFFAGDRDALAVVYEHARGPLVHRARKRPEISEDDADDLAINAILYVQGRGAKEYQPGRSLMALLNKSLDWQISAHLRRIYREICNSDLMLDLDTDDMGEEYEHPRDLEMFEENRLQEGAPQHEYLTSINSVTPEEELMEENLRAKLERFGREGAGNYAWEVYARVILDERSQADVAEEYGLSQQRVSQLVNDVVQAIRTRLFA